MKCDRCDGPLTKEQLPFEGISAWHCIYCGRKEYIGVCDQSDSVPKEDYCTYVSDVLTIDEDNTSSG